MRNESQAMSPGMIEEADEPVRKLADLLDELEREGRGLLSLLAEERRALGAVSLSAAEDIGARKLVRLQRLAELEQARPLLCDQLGAVLGIPPDRATVDEIARRLPAPVGERLKARAAGVLAVATAIQEQNYVIALVLSRALAFLHEAVTLIYAHAAPASAVYSVGGTPQGERGEGRLLRRKG